MPALKDTPTYNLKAVIRETGLKPDTLRAWERRYGLPQPHRTSGKHRLYSQRDIDILDWLIASQQEGLSISRAVEMWRRLEADGQDPLLAVASPKTGAKRAATPPVAGEAIAESRAAWLSACLNFDEPSAEQALAQAFAVYPPETVCFEVLQKGLSQIGDGWHRGEVSVQQEHFASALALRRLDALIASTSAPTRPGRILVTCPANEEHTFSPALITFLLRRRGWEVLYLGANVPATRLEAALAATRPNLVIAPAQQLYTAATLLDMARLVAWEKLAFAFGGLAFNTAPGLRDRIPGHFIGEKLEDVPPMVGRIMASPQPAADVVPTPPAYRVALGHYREKRPAIEAAVWDAIPAADRHLDHLALAGTHLARDIEAALALGDLEFMGADVEWLERLLLNRGIPPEAPRHFLSAYRRALQAHLGDHGKPVIDWLAMRQGED